jgi:uncharacterized membrane protein YecN with MAPEG domain
MTPIQAVGLYAGLNILLILFLAANVSRNRRRAKVSLGVGRDKGLEQACRAHGNATEYTPISLIGLALIAMMPTETLYIHALGITLTLGRFAHAYGLLTDGGPSAGRLLGTGLTWVALLGTGLVLLLKAFS